MRDKASRIKINKLIWGTSSVCINGIIGKSEEC